MTRRTVVKASAVIGAAVAAGSVLPVGSATAAERRGPKRPATSANGWTVQANTDRDSQVWTRPVSGTALGVPVWIGDVETVLVHVVRRFHYEVQELTAVDLAGWRPAKGLRRDLPESNLASGTAVRIRPGARARGSLFPLQVDAVRDILADCRGVVRWGGEDRPVDESLFYVAVGPQDERLPALAAGLREATFR
ncbi:twin-arginine translocation signal domain-containing protein [Streptomyces sp. NPDC005648]|uniref:twin-arginine translocation signal domain-containing protein n=1 Tax=Streptomyces sp. NPDC005648 TaxID=3157044 RepID=UPI0033B9DD25